MTFQYGAALFLRCGLADVAGEQHKAFTKMVLEYTSGRTGGISEQAVDISEQ